MGEDKNTGVRIDEEILEDFDTIWKVKSEIGLLPEDISRSQVIEMLMEDYIDDHSGFLEQLDDMRDAQAAREEGSAESGSDSANNDSETETDGMGKSSSESNTRGTNMASCSSSNSESGSSEALGSGSVQ